MSIENLEPKKVWKHFYALTQIARPSKHEEKAVKFVTDFGKKLGLKTIVDEVGNVIICKPATKGMENCKGIILQSHLDMVPQKNSDVAHDFEKDPIQAYIDGEWVKAKGTTLGADNGLGVALAMAILEADDLQHGALEALFTVDEETGMTGALNLKPDLLKGDILINLDSEEVGELCIGCAGGLNANFTFTYKEEAAPAGYEAYKINVTGLKGGHSGCDIHLGRGNSCKIIFRVLKQLEKEGVRLASVEAGNMRNAIPREGVAIVVAPAGKAIAVKNMVEEVQKTVFAELAAADAGVKITIASTAMPASVMDTKSQQTLYAGVYACPSGVVRMSDAMPNLVETSNNLSIVKSEKGKVEITCLLRSSVDSAKEDLSVLMRSLFEIAGAQCEFSGGYPGWRPNPASPILAAMKEILKKMTGKEPIVNAVHAGLECGLLGGKYPDLDMISCGPTVMNPHSPDEKTNIASVDFTWKFLVEALKNTPKK